MIIRHPTKSDSKALSVLMDELGYKIAPEHLEVKIEEFAKNEQDVAYVAENKGEIVGCITCHITTLFHQLGYSGRITSLVITETSRGTGVGYELMEYAEHFFKEKGCVKVEVTSGPHRREAHEFYLRCGFQKDEMRFIKQYV